MRSGGVASLSRDSPHPEVLQLCSAIRDAGMHVGITVKPETDVELLFPYVDAAAVDMVSGSGRVEVNSCWLLGWGLGRTADPLPSIHAVVVLVSVAGNCSG